MSQTHEFFATSPKGIEPLLAVELLALGASEARDTRGGARFVGTLEMAYRACLWSRLANRILLPLATFPAHDADALYAGTQRIDWDIHLRQGGTFAVDSAISSSMLTHSQFVALRVKDAIVDAFRTRHGERPSVSVEKPDLQINVFLHKDECTISVDLSGTSLHQRGYRIESTAAPLKENLAAAILLRAGWPDVAKAGGALVDPMCGSGTFCIEAAFMAADRAPGLTRDYFGFLGWAEFDPTIWEKLKDEAHARFATGRLTLPVIHGYDHHPGAIRAALTNVEQAGLRGAVHIERRGIDMAPADGLPATPGLVVVNPPYGERLGSDETLPDLYKALGKWIVQYCMGWRASVLTNDVVLGKSIGLHARKVHALYNGALECKLLHFDVIPDNQLRSKRLPRLMPLEQRGPGAEMFANRLHKNIKELKRWLRDEEISCYRLYDADMPEYAVAIDIYNGAERWVHVQEYAAPNTIDPEKAITRLREAMSVIREVLEVPDELLFLKVRQQQKGHSQYEKLGDAKHFHEIQEYGCRLLVNFEDYLDTGVFLDHRLTRRMLGELTQGKSFLNLFAYTGSATVHAACAGAVRTTTVDMSNTYLEWAEQNFSLNKLSGSAHEVIHANCLDWIADMRGKREYDVIFLDPPTFSTSKRMTGTLDIQRDHAELIRQTMWLLEEAGTLVFSTNREKFKMDLAALADFQLTDITAKTIPPDFARHARIHQCWLITW